MNPIRFAIRSLARARLFSVAAIATIAVGIGAGCAVFGLVNAVLLRPLPYANSDRLVGLWHAMPGMGIPTAKQSPGTYTIYREGAKSFEAIGVYVSLAATLTYGTPDGAPERVRAAYMTPAVFAVLGAKPLLGRLFADADADRSAPRVAVISERLWKTQFNGDKRVTDQNIQVDGATRRIIGVMPEQFAFPATRSPIWIPLDLAHPQYAGSFGYDGIGRLRPGATIESARRELEQILIRLPERFPEMRPGVSTAVGLRQTRLAPVVHPMRDDVVAGFDRVLWLIAGTVMILVIVAFSNVASLVLVRVEARRRELAIRSALGASAWGVWQGVMAETAIIAATGGALGAGLAAVALRLLVQAGPLDLPRVDEVHLDAEAMLAAAALTVLFAMMSAAIGAFRIRSSDVARILRDGGRAGTSGRTTQRMRFLFVAVEVALALVLLAGSAVLGRSVLRLRAVQPGFNPSNTFTFWTFLPGASYRRPSDAARFYREAIGRIEQLPGVVAVGATAKLPLEIEGFPYKVLIWADDGSPASSALPPVFQSTTASSGYFNALQIPMLAGRSFDDVNVRRGALEAVASRGFVEHFWHDATGRSGLGKRVRPTATGPWYTIVGVVGDVRDSTLTQPPISEVYFPEEANPDTSAVASQTTARDMAFVVRTSGPAPGLPALLRRELHSLDPNLPFYRPATMEQVVDDARSKMTFALLLLAVGAGTTLLLGVVGLYGVIAYVVSLRSREISIRIALGLAPNGAARMILRQGGMIVAIGACAGTVMFLAFSRLLASLAFEVSTLDVRTLAGAVAGVVIVATVATWIPARRAAAVNPADALKAD